MHIPTKIRAAGAVAALSLAAISTHAQNPPSPYAPQNSPPSPYAPSNNPPSPYAPQNNPPPPANPPPQSGATSAIPVPKPPPVYGATTGQQPVVTIKYETPNVEVTSIKVPAGRDPNARALGITGKVRFSRPPQTGYIVEVFFMCHPPITNDRFIILTTVLRKEGAVSEFEATVPNFNPDDTAERVRVPGPGSSTGLNAMSSKPAAPKLQPVLAPGARPEPTPQLPQTPKGAKYEGWIVRITAGGQILRVDSNQPALADLARQQQDIFDTAAIHKMPPDPRADAPAPR